MLASQRPAREQCKSAHVVVEWRGEGVVGLGRRNDIDIEIRRLSRSYEADHLPGITTGVTTHKLLTGYPYASTCTCHFNLK